MDTVSILNIKINSIRCDDLLNKMDEGIIFTPNIDHLIKLQKDKELYDVYKQADWILCDSKIIYFLSRIFKKKIEEPIPGSSFLPKFYKHHRNNENIKIFLLGAATGVAASAKERINKQLERTTVIGAHSPSFGFENNKEECDEIIHKINNSEANVLVVGLGAPKQEKWIIKYKDKLPKVKIFMALGATIDFEAGNVKRAPELFQILGLEWFYRLIKEPRRLWKRYLIDDLPFFYLILKQKLGIYKDPFKNN